MRNALSIAAGAWSETSVPTMLLRSRSKLISPRLRVTGSISSSTRRTSGSRQLMSRVNLNGVFRRSHAGAEQCIEDIDVGVQAKVLKLVDDEDVRCDVGSLKQSLQSEFRIKD